MPAIIPPWMEVTPSQFGDAAARGAQLSLGRAQLAEDARQANMRAAQASAALAAEAKAREDEMRRKDQEAQISHQYEQAQIGLKTRALNQAQEQFDFETQQAARLANVQLEYRRRVASGEDPVKVGSELGPMMGLTGAQLANIMKGAPKLGENVPVNVPGMTGVRTSAERIQLVPTGQEPGGPLKTDVVLNPITGQPIPTMFAVPGASGRRNVHTIPQQSDAAIAAAMINQRQGGGAAESALPVEPPTRTATSLPQGFHEGQRITQKSTGKTGTIINGVPVWDDEQPEPETPVAEENPYEGTGLPGTRGFFYSGQNYDTPAQ